jgi:hypothetical protein
MRILADSLKSLVSIRHVMPRMNADHVMISSRSGSVPWDQRSSVMAAACMSPKSWFSPPIAQQKA